MSTEEYGVFAGFAILSLLFAFAAIFTSFLLRAKASNKNKNATYECGMKSDSEAQIKFSAKYYLLAILFIVFEVETIFLFPWAMALKKLGLASLVAGVFFVLVLLLGWAYALRYGFFDYERERN